MDSNKGAINSYCGFLKKFANPQKKVVVVFDCSNGVAGEVLKNLRVERLKTLFINEKPDGDFPAHGPDPMKEGVMDQLKDRVIKEEADLGVIFDADGDRMFLVDDKGRSVEPDITATLLMGYLKPGKIAIDARAGFLARNAGDAKVFETRVGHYFIKNLMRAKDIDFAFEKSGHYYFKDFFYADSGILAAIFAVNAVSRLPYGLADFADLSDKYFRIRETNIGYRTSDTGYRELLERIEREYGNRAVRVSKIDGLSMTFEAPDGKWFFNLRPSNTEPYLRLNAEATDEKLLDGEVRKLTSIIKTCNK